MNDEADKANEDQSRAAWEMTFLDRWIDKSGRLFSYLILLSGLAIVYEVFARYLFGAPTIWSHETTTFLCALCFALGGSYCLARNSHIRIVILYDRVSEKHRRYLDLFSSFAGLVWGCMLVYAASTLVRQSWFTPWGEFRMETSASAWDPPFPALIKGFLMLSLVIMTMQFFLRLIKTIRQK